MVFGDVAWLRATSGCAAGETHVEYLLHRFMEHTTAQARRQ